MFYFKTHYYIYVNVLTVFYLVLKRQQSGFIYFCHELSIEFSYDVTNRQKSANFDSN